ncbi:hypothetical protein ACO0TE_26430, partial [Klebsiella quasipneumoniae]|uniref:hypothetical protein n=1 Tax=Klebsiella quasipneumoniae TaxID=1463165 RepID=UPI003BF2A825
NEPATTEIYTIEQSSAASDVYKRQSKWFVILNLNESAFIIILLYSNELCCFVAGSVNQMKLFLLIYG